MNKRARRETKGFKEGKNLRQCRAWETSEQCKIWPTYFFWFMANMLKIGMCIVHISHNFYIRHVKFFPFVYTMCVLAPQVLCILLVAEVATTQSAILEIVVRHVQNFSLYMCFSMCLSTSQCLLVLFDYGCYGPCVVKDWKQKQQTNFDVHKQVKLSLAKHTRTSPIQSRSLAVSLLWSTHCQLLM